MEKQQLSLGKKVKMKLVQPDLKCIGREDVVCFYRGKVIQEITKNLFTIEFKYKGKKVQSVYSVPLNEFNTIELKDIKII